jgi:hypothetical protein
MYNIIEGIFRVVKRKRGKSANFVKFRGFEGRFWGRRGLLSPPV